VVKRGSIYFERPLGKFKRPFRFLKTS